MNWTQSVFELIDMRSFSNLWFWIALAVLWSSTSHWVVGVPWDLIQRAARKGGQAMEDMQDLTRININRILYITDVSGLWLMTFACFAITTLGVLGFYYQIEFGQALFLLGLPMSIVGLLTIRTARKIRAKELAGDALVRCFRLHRIAIQIVAMISIFITGFWGMYQNVTVGALGG
ncbi:component of SufBCD complex [Actibacterium mucosum KCTC 23349]|uniref:Component of SufBCD complex n=1 Tax=Actibacterium mucosum KCTC 23349 TaxID=1454373 RepID=A0A037ZPP2_9RHOB|nr:hypothetical protein [Actibacterium mucosum]KAJ56801.1 component of SufBCD complex [Actibacterium mucosum KCTC 23349]